MRGQLCSKSQIHCGGIKIQMVDNLTKMWGSFSLSDDDGEEIDDRTKFSTRNKTNYSSYSVCASTCLYP
jgi:hypothetical protein